MNDKKAELDEKKAQLEELQSDLYIYEFINGCRCTRNKD
jgi:hypothetical protein